jgi:hypothetical protein
MDLRDVHHGWRGCWRRYLHPRAGLVETAVLHDQPSVVRVWFADRRYKDLVHRLDNASRHLVRSKPGQRESKE